MCDSKPSLYRKAVLKFYGDRRFDELYTSNFITEMKDRHKTILSYFRFFPDFEKTIGIHYNIVFKSRSYHTFLRLYNIKSDLKDKNVFLFMEPIKNVDVFIDWISYCQMRQSTNYKDFVRDRSKVIANSRKTCIDDMVDNSDIKYVF